LSVKIDVEKQAVDLRRLRQNSFLVLGRAGMDLYADPPGARIEEAARFTSALGGSAANIAVGIVKLGGRAALISAVSDDAVGRFTLNQLRHYGVGTAHVTRAGGEARNSLAVVETRNEDCQSVIYRNGAADLALTSRDVEAIAYGDFAALVVTGTSLALEPSRSAAFAAMELARKAGLVLVLDVDYRPYSWPSAAEACEVCARAAAMSDIVVGNDVEFAVMAGSGDGRALARRLAARDGRIAVYKMGGQGSVTWTGETSFATGVYAVDALKPTGAGDAFMAGLLTSLAAGLDLETAVGRGSAAAAITVTRVGCAPAMPEPRDLETFIAGRTVSAPNSG
jgi:5-dehydro-2-deoxygluconokinase